MKARLYFYESAINRFSMAYLLFMLEKAGYREKFDITIFKSDEELAGIFEKDEFARQASVFVYSFMTPLLPYVMRHVPAIRSAAARESREEDVVVIAGGPHVTGDPDSGEKLGFDLVFCGEGENVWPEFLETAYQAGCSKNFRSEVLSRYGSRAIRDERPVDMNGYLPFGEIYGFVPPLEIMRGCYYNCRFCQTSTCKVRYRSMESVEMFFAEYRRRSYKRLCFICPSAFHYMSPNVRELRLDIIEEMLDLAGSKYDIKYIEYAIFPSEARPETITERSADIVKKYCSNNRISVGAQSGDEDRIRKIGRGHLLDSVFNACEILDSRGFVPVVDFIFGFPGEDEAEQLKTLATIKKLHTNFRARIQTHYFLPLPGTPLYNERSAPISPMAQKLLEKYSAGGICTDWYKEGIRQSAEITAILDGLKN
ncbi:MAG TPA: TIGR04013 family B12-binding domain/radical SAM domain-containing protein [Candidatus Wallbacteria bacterium]|nr:TIGR04013 family B12-binding domain/radical SAM domain-containing protein [Candidatus Wallbacteria bacterium]